MKSKIIGTGLSGLVGSRIVELLGDEFDFVDLSLQTGIDILDKAALEKAFRENATAKTVLHLAAFTDTNEAQKQNGDKNGLCYRLNVLGTENIASLCQKYGQKLIYCSTDYVFDGEKVSPYTEEDAPHPIDWYGQTKFEGEKIVLEKRKNATVCRISFPFRAKFEAKKDLIRKMIDGFRQDSLYPMFTDQITTPTFIDDIAAAFSRIIKASLSGIFHVTGSTSQSPYETALLVAEVFGFDKSLVRKGNLAEYEEAQGQNSRKWQRNLAMDNSKITGLGVKMQNLKEALLGVKKQMEES